MYRELEAIRERLLAYIESAYHLSDPHLVSLRRELLERPEVICHAPYLESSARYASGKPYADLQIPSAARELLSLLSKPESGNVIFPVPYQHQAAALEAVLANELHHTIVTTGTGSGKTETFLLPILGRLAREASETPGTFKTRAVRALLLYPMNALVNDQLARLRRLLGAPATRTWFTTLTGRPAKFGRYTSRTPFPGVLPDDTAKLRKKFAGFDFYVDLENNAATDPKSQRLLDSMRRMGKWPAKDEGDQPGLASWMGRGAWFNSTGTLKRTVERTSDTELLTRLEIQTAPPDLLVTNYSMLEYMMLRPIERGIFRQTRQYFADHPSERFILVLDEAHLYRGAQGTEVAMLIRRLKQRLGLASDQLQVITTSASFEDPHAAVQFAAGLSGTDPARFVPLTGKQIAIAPSGFGTTDEAKAFASVDLPQLLAGTPAQRFAAIRPLLLLPNATDSLKTAPFCVTVLAQATNVAEAAVRISGFAADGAPVGETIRVPIGGSVVTKGHYLILSEMETEPPLEAHAGPAGGPVEFHNLATELLSPGAIDQAHGGLSRILFGLLAKRPVTGRLLNLTSGSLCPTDAETSFSLGAQEIGVLAGRLFPGIESEVARRATDVLVESASLARAHPSAPPLFAARVHRFFRGVAGIWACSNPHCDGLPDAIRGRSLTGQLYVQPQRTCSCGSRVFELHACRSCGTPFLLAYTQNPRKPDYLWHEDVGQIDDVEGTVVPLHLWLEDPHRFDTAEEAEVRDFDLEPLTGRLFGDTGNSSETTRRVFLPPERPPGKDSGLFSQCPRCRDQYHPISDLKTKGDEPFQHLLTAQLMAQPPHPDVDTALKGRKLLVFSDGRQPASRLAGKLKANSLRDAIRPLLLTGLRVVSQRWWSGATADVSLKHAYLALLVGAEHREVALRPQLRDQEQVFYKHVGRVKELLISVGAERSAFEMLSDQLSLETPHAILLALYEVLFNPLTGVHSLALGRLIPLLSEYQYGLLDQLPAPDALTSVDAPRERRQAVLEFWMHRMVRDRAVWLRGTPTEWIGSPEQGASLNPSAGKFQAEMIHRLGSAFYNQQLSGGARAASKWRDFLSQTLGKAGQAGNFLLDAAFVALDCDHAQWVRCDVCTSVIPVSTFLGDRCPECRSTNSLQPLSDTTADNYAVFEARKGLYRRSVVGVDAAELRPFVAEEHTAAIGAIDAQDAFSRAEWHEMRFQDLDVKGPAGEPGGTVDVLSCTTTMEVGIDIGSLTAVSLRNVPPNRANYQQRAGRAGRRGSSLSTVITYADQGTHDQRYFRDPAAMISGPVTDPVLNLDNMEIVRRHGFALILTLFQQARIADSDNTTANANVFSSLGRVEAFTTGDETGFSFRGLRSWIADNRAALLSALREIAPQPFLERNGEISLTCIPDELLIKLNEIGCGECEPATPSDDAALIVSLYDEYFEDDDPIGTGSPSSQTSEDADDRAETPDSARRTENLLDLLFDRALLPSYAFPTDVVSLTVFDKSRSTPYRTVTKYAPQRGLDQALSNYAPGREVFIDGYRHYSFALWSPIPNDRRNAWDRRELYYECDRCGYARIESLGGEHFVGRTVDCPACTERAGFGPAITWMKPPGFAHPVDMNEDLAISEPPDLTRPTQAKLSAAFDEKDGSGETFSFGNRGFTRWSAKEMLFLTNRGSEQLADRGFIYCLSCGRIEPKGWRSEQSKLNARLAHIKPYPNHLGHPNCKGFLQTVSLGTRFPSDVALLRLQFGNGLLLPPGSSLARLTLTTIAQALAVVAADSLEIDRANIGAEFRPALTPQGRTGIEADIYLYDTTSGGAGFVRAAAADPVTLLEATLALLDGCDCSGSCYKCLRSYSNRFVHADLDRSLGAALLRHVLNHEPYPQLDSVLEDRLLTVLARDLSDLGHRVERFDGYLELPDRAARRIVLAHGLCPDRAGSDRAVVALQSGSNNAPPINHLRVDRALPAAVRDCLGVAAAVSGPGLTLPEHLSDSPTGVPVYTLALLKGSWPAEPIRQVAVNLDSWGLEDPFLLLLDGHQLDRLKPDPQQPGWTLSQGSILVFDREAAVVPTEQHAKGFVILCRLGDTFRATGHSTTVGQCRVRTVDGQNVLNVSYRSVARDCVPQSVKQEGAVVLGSLVGALKGRDFQRLRFS